MLCDGQLTPCVGRSHETAASRQQLRHTIVTCTRILMYRGAGIVHWTCTANLLSSQTGNPAARQVRLACLLLNDPSALHTHVKPFQPQCSAHVLNTWYITLLRVFHPLCDSCQRCAQRQPSVPAAELGLPPTAACCIAFACYCNRVTSARIPCVRHVNSVRAFVAYGQTDADQLRYEAGDLTSDSLPGRSPNCNRVTPADSLVSSIMQQVLQAIYCLSVCGSRAQHPNFGPLQFAARCGYACICSITKWANATWQRQY